MLRGASVLVVGRGGEQLLAACRAMERAGYLVAAAVAIVGEGEEVPEGLGYRLVTLRLADLEG